VVPRQRCHHSLVPFCRGFQTNRTKLPAEPCLEGVGCKTGETKVGVGANALTGLAGKILPNPRIARFEGVVCDPGLLISEFGIWNSELKRAREVGKSKPIRANTRNSRIFPLCCTQ